MDADLFGEIPVLIDELLIFMLAVPGIAPDSPRFWRYVTGYHVIEKIQRAKAADSFDELVTEPARAVPFRLAHVLEQRRPF